MNESVFLPFKKIADAKWFHHLALALILINAVIIGVETSHTVMVQFGGVLKWVNVLFQVAFVTEIVIRILACGPRFHHFFKDGWNVFDFVIVAASLLPAAGPLAMVARIARVLRILRVVTAYPELKLIVNTMLKSIPSMGHVILLVALLMYVYGIIGFYKFGAIDPDHWGTLGRSLLSLFQVLTLEGWADMQAKVMVEKPWAWLFFGSFVVIAVFVVINLFIAVVTNNLQQAKLEEEQSREQADRELLGAVRDLKDRLDRYERSAKN
jgi:voltage-gated sodium channel